jgi:tetratricopeptide (TPR) repeat protein
MEEHAGTEGPPLLEERARRSPWGYLLVAAVVAAMLASGYWLATKPAPVEVSGAASQEALMKAGLDALYTKKNPGDAVLQFHKVLSKNPDHYGATYQLATALDRAGRSDEARPYWEKMVKLAEAAKDETTLATVQGRLGRTVTTTGPEPAGKGGPPLKPAPESEETLMKAGLDALYTRNNPGEAAAQFRKVLERRPTHYGATYQLATALDRAGQPTEARPLWERVLKMADGYKDTNTAATARARLARAP